MCTIDRIGIPKSEAIAVYDIPNSEAIDVFGVSNSEAIYAKYVPSLASTFELQKQLSRCLKSWMNFFTLLQFSGVLNASPIKSF